MFIRYLNDMKSWVLFFLVPLGFVNLLIWLDNGLSIQIGSVLYLNLLLLEVYSKLAITDAQFEYNEVINKFPI